VSLRQNIAPRVHQGVLLVINRPVIFQMAAAALDDAESLINLTRQKKSSVRSNPCTGEINENGPVEIRPDDPFLSFTIPEHALNLRST